MPNVAGVVTLIDQDIRLSQLGGVDLAPHAEAISRLRAQIEATWLDFRDDFLRETATSDDAMRKEALDNLFDMYLGDGLRDDIEAQCESDDPDLTERIWHELKRRVAELAFAT